MRALSKRTGKAANQRVAWRGVTLDARTIDALLLAERISGVKVTPTQGSFRPKTPYSGTVHRGSSTVDVSVRGLTVMQRKRLVRAMKEVGFAVWYRTTADGFTPHIHGVLIGGGKDGAGTIGGNTMDPAAGRQVKAFDAGRNGLVSNKPDPTYRPSKRRFSWQQGTPVAR